ncbi:spore coat U domain-containing protein [Serratia sp. N21D137]|uniref:Csu type fimbrial protein n=1 Tax=Serratia sp. N21D137 TaxID=3397495 RepID=UPI0039E031A0
MRLNKFAGAILFASSVCFVMGSSSAATQLDSSFNVKIAISSMCTLKTIDDVDFGTVDTNTATKIERTQLSVKCNDQQPYLISLKPSNNSINGQGMMTSGDGLHKINYSLYQDPQATVPAGSDANAFGGTGTGKNVNHNVYVKVLGSEFDKPSGHYNDVISVAVNY